MSYWSCMVITRLQKLHWCWIGSLFGIMVSSFQRFLFLPFFLLSLIMVIFSSKFSDTLAGKYPLCYNYKTAGMKCPHLWWSDWLCPNDGKLGLSKLSHRELVLFPSLGKSEVYRHERGYSSGISWGYSNLWLRQHVQDGFYERRASCWCLIQVPSVLHGTSAWRRCGRSNREIQQALRQIRSGAEQRCSASFIFQDFVSLLCLFRKFRAWRRNSVGK